MPGLIHGALHLRDALRGLLLCSRVLFGSVLGLILGFLSCLFRTLADGILHTVDVEVQIGSDLGGGLAGEFLQEPEDHSKISAEYAPRRAGAGSLLLGSTAVWRTIKGLGYVVGLAGRGIRQSVGSARVTVGHRVLPWAPSSGEVLKTEY